MKRTQVKWILNRTSIDSYHLSRMPIFLFEWIFKQKKLLRLNYYVYGLTINESLGTTTAQMSVREEWTRWWILDAIIKVRDTLLGGT